MLVCVREGRFPSVTVTQYCMSGYSLSADSRAIAELMPIISRTSSIASTKRTSQSTIYYLGREAHARLEIERLRVHLALAPIRRLTHHFVRPDCRAEPNHWIGTNTRLRPHRTQSFAQ
jgi:hypothetical protein